MTRTFISEKKIGHFHPKRHCNQKQVVTASNSSLFPRRIAAYSFTVLKHRRLQPQIIAGRGCIRVLARPNTFLVVFGHFLTKLPNGVEVNEGMSWAVPEESLCRGAILDQKDVWITCQFRLEGRDWDRETFIPRDIEPWPAHSSRLWSQVPQSCCQSGQCLR